MAFAHGREPFTTSQKRAAGAALPTTHDPQEVSPVRSPNTLRPTSDAELLDAAERMDAGLRLAVPMLFEDTERLSVDAVPVTKVPGPEFDDELIGAVGDKVAAFRDEAFRELRHLDKHAPRKVHIRALMMVAEMEAFLSEVADYFRSQS
jgi:hypothetical protein